MRERLCDIFPQDWPSSIGCPYDPAFPRSRAFVFPHSLLVWWW